MKTRIKKINYRILLGALLISGGLLGLLEKFGVINDASRFFWVFIFGIAGAAFLYIFLTDKEHWWSIIPGFSSIGLAITVGLPVYLDNYGGLAFLGGLGLGFFTLYIVNRKRWWAIIPSGVLTTLGIISVLSNSIRGQDTGALFFIGLGLTFLLVGILPSGLHRMNWAFIPSTILLLFGFLLGTSFRSSLDFIWIGFLFLGGIYMIWQFFKK